MPHGLEVQGQRRATLRWRWQGAGIIFLIATGKRAAKQQRCSGADASTQHLAARQEALQNRRE